MGTALIVEDHPDQAEMVGPAAPALATSSPIIAGDGETGLELARQLQPDVVLLDLMLPDINGFDVCRRLRSDRADDAHPVVMLTALDDDQNRRQGFRVGANAYVTKPYGAEDLFEAIAAARAWRVRMEQGHIQGEIHVELNSEITLLQDLNDFLMTLCQSTPLDHEQVMHLRQAVMEMAPERHRVGQPAPDPTGWSTSPTGSTTTASRSSSATRGAGFDRANLPHAAVADDPFAHLDVRDKLGLRAGGFGLMICKGMVDELRYNDVGNEVTLIKRFQATSRARDPADRSPTRPTDPRPEALRHDDRRPTLLVVDDEPEVLRSVHDLLPPRLPRPHLRARRRRPRGPRSRPRTSTSSCPTSGCPG